MKNLLLSCVFIPMAAFGAGGQNQHGNPIFGDDCVTITPPGISLEDCELSVAPSHSGIQVYFCLDEVVVLCPPEEDDDD